MAKKVAQTTLGGMSISVTDNSEEVQRALKNAIDRALWSIGATAEGHAKDIITALGRVDTGRMRDSIAHVEDDTSTVFGTNVDYAIFQELGTVDIRPAKFLTRAATEHNSEYKQIVKQSLENA